jgi:hypothetical protein
MTQDWELMRWDYSHHWRELQEGISYPIKQLGKRFGVTNVADDFEEHRLNFKTHGKRRDKARLAKKAYCSGYQG